MYVPQGAARRRFYADVAPAAPRPPREPRTGDTIISTLPPRLQGALDKVRADFDARIKRAPAKPSMTEEHLAWTIEVRAGTRVRCEGGCGRPRRCGPGALRADLAAGAPPRVTGGETAPHNARLAAQDLERRQQTTSSSLNDEKKLLKEIKALKNEVRAAREPGGAWGRARVVGSSSAARGETARHEFKWLGASSVLGSLSSNLLLRARVGRG